MPTRKCCFARALCSRACKQKQHQNTAVEKRHSADQKVNVTCGL